MRRSLSMPSIALRLLGTPVLERDGSPIEFRRNKSIALLAYLALARARPNRDAVAALLWPNVSAENALASLRNAVWEIHQIDGGLIEATRLGIELGRGQGFWVDVRRFHELLGPARGTAAQPLLAPTRAAMAGAVALWRGDFLKGLIVRDCGELQDWITQQQEHFRRRMRDTLHALADDHGARGELDEAIRYAQQLVSIEPTDERAHRRVMELWASAGQRAQALRQYDACVAILDRELSVAPEPETRALAARIRAGDDPPPASTKAPSSRPPASLRFLAHAIPSRPALPASSGIFVGRARELAIIVERLDDPGCRLVSITGLGGAGKTSLALEAARRCARAFRDGAALIPLAGVRSDRDMVPVISDALGLAPSAQEPPEARLLAHLRDKQMLLIADGCEELLDRVQLLGRILDAAPEVRVIATARERLRLRAEWELHIEGLALPAGGGDLGAAEQSDATALFVATARRLEAGFEVTPQDLPAVVRICRAVDGLPLGIELAAAWVRRSPVAEIADRIEGSLDFLVAPRDAPERQRSLRASFLHSWALLSSAEQDALRRLSVVRGGVHVDAARAISGVSSDVLSSLAEKFLLHRNRDRYEMHQVIQQYAHEALVADPAEHAAARGRLAEHCAALLEAGQPSGGGVSRRAAVQAIEAEIDNIRAIWAWWTEEARLDDIARGLDGFAMAHASRDRFREASEALGRVTATLLARLDDPKGPHAALLGRVLAWRGRFAVEIAPLDEAALLIQEALRLLADAGARAATAVALDAAGRLALLQGDHGAARWSFRGALALGKKASDRATVAGALRGLAAVATSGGEHRKAERLLARSIETFRALGDPRSVATCFAGLGDVFMHRGDLERADVAYRKGLTEIDAIGDRRLIAELLDRLARLLLARGDVDEALRRHTMCLEIGRAIAHTETIASALCGLGLAAARRGELREARARAEESLSLRRRTSARRGIAESLGALGAIAASEGAVDQARGYLRAALGVAVEIAAGPLQLEILVSLVELSRLAHMPPRLRRALAAIQVHPSASHAARGRAAALLGPRAADRLPIQTGSMELSGLIEQVLAVTGL